ncbi:histidine phosphatase family protein [Frigoribacterium faeni]|uniref:Phosphatase PhoE n=1 Tax=Frigoribacterium faeni TaxID=145483 RepID=A0A7W3PIQ9_9MICO|nr:histidine phosphatase family protein [Frigoribacterium faeni]MBA8812924.1 putative phosphoglycerate mutase [Frigoribacterium faeni]BFF14078.1 phosphatase PhoE [Microbacterium flavescens]GEK81964.1 putative phosphatase PhoE [Frigoribacterium faeni]
MTLLYLVRHGETDWNRARRIQGATDIPLNDLGRSQAREAGDLLARRRVTAVVASPLSRARETGSIIAERLGLGAPALVPEVAERRYGDAEGLTGTEVEARFPVGTPVPGRESRRELVARVLPALIEVGRVHDGGLVVVATHGAVIRAVVNHVSPATEAHVGIPIRNGSIHSFEFDGDRLVLREFDDPIEVESESPGTYDFGYQNALESSAADEA